MRLVDALAITGGGLRGPLFQSAGTDRAPALPPLEPGTRFGPYALEDVLGHGGMATVYRARRCDGAFEQVVALKVAAVPRELRAHAQRERDVLGRLHHPLIASIFDAGETPDGLAWFAMEYVDGWSIDEYVRRRRCDWRARVQLLQQLCRALHYAHQFLVLHRDVKPSNVLVSADGHLKLMDFGVAGTLAPGAAADPSRAPLTPGYASPEQLAGDPVGVPSDVYQVGLVLEELLLSARHDTQQMLQLRGPCRRNLAAIAAKATDLDPDARYASVAEIEAELQRVLESHPVRARRWPAAFRLRLFGRRHPLLARALLAGAIALVAACTYLGQVTAHSRDLRARETHDAESSRLFLANLLRSAPLGAATPAAGIVDMLDRGAAQTRELMAAQPRERVIAVETLMEAYAAVGARDKAYALFESTQRDFDTHHAGLTAERARLATALIRCYECFGAVATPQAYQAAIANAERLLDAAGIAQGTTERLILGKAKVIQLESANRMEEAVALADTLIAAAEANGLTNNGQFATIVYWRGMIQWIAFDDLPRALHDMRYALDVIAPLYGPGHDTVIALSALLAQVAAQAGDYAYADELVRRRETEAYTAYGERSVEYGRALSARGALLANWGAPSEARAAYDLLERAHGIVEAVDPLLYYTDVTSYAYGLVLLDQGRAAEAQQLFTTMLGVYRNVYASAHPVVLMVNIELADATCRAGDGVAALKSLEQLRAQGIERARNRGIVAEYWLRYADCQARSGNASAAREIVTTHLAQLDASMFARRSRTLLAQLRADPVTDAAGSR